MFKRLYPIEYTPEVSTRVSNALLVGERYTNLSPPSIYYSRRAGEVFGQIVVGILCDRVGRKAGLVMTTMLIIIGAILCTIARGANGSAHALFWFMTFARGITGVVSLLVHLVHS